MGNQLRLVATAALVVIALAALGIAGNMDKQDAEQRHSTYCEMVQTFKESNGAYGWPDYKGIYQEVCK